MRKKYTGVLAALAVGILVLGTGMGAEASRTGTITTDGSRVRASADAEGQKVCSLPVDTIVDITDEAESGGKTWYQISFTLDGEQKTGWIRSDLLSVSETEDAPEEITEEAVDTAEGEEGESTETASAGAYTILEPESEYENADALDKTTISIGDQEYTAYQSLVADQLYLVWASKEDGSTGWYWYDPAEETFQQDLGQFSQQGLVNSLQNELTTLKSSSAKALSQRLFLIIGLGVVCVILLILTIVFANKSKRGGEDFEEEDDEREDEEAEFEDEEPEPDEDEEPEDEPEEELEEEKPKKRRGLFRHKKRGDEEDFEESPYDELVYEEKKNQDFSLTGDLPEIDLSALDEEANEEEESEEEPEIEILDLDDLNL